MKVQGRWVAGLGVAALMACGGRADKSTSGDGDLGGANGDSEDPDDEGVGGMPDNWGGWGTGGSWGLGAGGLVGDASGGFTFTPLTCPAGSFDPDVNDDTVDCEPWTICQAGTYIETLASPVRDNVCVPCEEGYTSESNERMCHPWTLCRYSQLELTAESSTANPTCAAKEGYPEYNPYGDYSGVYLRNGPLTVTPQGTHQLIGGYRGDPYYETIIVYAQTGELSVVLDNRRVLDLGALGQNLLVLGTDSIQDQNAFIETGYLQARAASGTVTWQTDLSDSDEDHWTHAQVSIFDDEVYVVSRVVDRDCVYDASYGGMVCDEDKDVPQLFLQVLSDQGELQETITLEDDTDIIGVLDMKVTSDGHIYIAAEREAEKPAVCATLDDYDAEYIELCWDLRDVTLLEYGPAGDLQGEHLMGTLTFNSAKLVPTSEGTVYAFIRSEDLTQPRLLLLGAGEETLLDKELPAWVAAFTTTADGLFFVGADVETGEQVFAEADLSGEPTEITRESGYAPFAAVDVTVGPSGGILMAGFYGYNGFVRPWPD